MTWRPRDALPNWRRSKVVVAVCAFATHLNWLGFREWGRQHMLATRGWFPAASHLRAESLLTSRYWGAEAAHFCTRHRRCQGLWVLVPQRRGASAVLAFAHSLLQAVEAVSNPWNLTALSTLMVLAILLLVREVLNHFLALGQTILAWVGAATEAIPHLERCGEELPHFVCVPVTCTAKGRAI